MIRDGVDVCLRNHPLVEGNIYRRPDNPAKRECKTCRRERKRNKNQERVPPPDSKPCAVCGRLFYRSDWGGRFAKRKTCSPECAGQLSSRRVNTVGVFIEMPPDKDTTWRNSALCRDYDPEKWFPQTKLMTEQINEAKAICDRCPVKVTCGEWGLLAGAEGIWGGMFLPHEAPRRRAPSATRVDPATVDMLAVSQVLDGTRDGHSLSPDERVALARLVRAQPDGTVNQVMKLLRVGHREALRVWEAAESTRPRDMNWVG